MRSSKKHKGFYRETYLRLVGEYRALAAAEYNAGRGKMVSRLEKACYSRMGEIERELGFKPAINYSCISKDLRDFDSLQYSHRMFHINRRNRMTWHPTPKLP